MPEIHGNTEGIRKTVLDELTTLYDVQLEPGQFMPQDLLQSLCGYSASMNRELAVYITRYGEIADIFIGRADSIDLPDLRLRRGERRLSMVRCVHTHPRATGELSDVDVSALLSMLLYMLATLLPTALCEVRQVELRMEDRRVILPAMLDSGNLLSDPVTGLPVLVVPEKALKTLFPGVEDLCDLKGLPLGFRLLNVRTAAGGALLPMFRPDECRLYLNGHACDTELLVAVAGREYGGVQALVPMAALPQKMLAQS